MCHSLRRAIAWVLVGQIAAAAAPLYARQARAHNAVFTVEALKKTVARAAATTQTAAIDKRLREQWAKVQRLERGAKVLVAVEGQALARRSVRDVYDDAIVLAAADGIAVRVARDDIDKLVVPAHGSQPAAVAMGFLGFFFGFAAAATSAPNKPVGYAVILGTPIAFGMAGYHGLRTGDKVLYARP